MKMEHAEDAGSHAEAELIEAAQNDPTAFGPLYERYVDRIYRYAYRRVGNHADAEDVTSQTFQQALAALPDYEWRGVPFGAWLYRIAGNVITRRGRSSNREITVEDVTSLSQERAEDDEDPAEIVAERQENELTDALRQLPLDQQRVIVLRFSRDMKNREIGEVMGRSEGAVKQLLHRAMIALRATLESNTHG
ncbi:MAG: sigma-70 family RNA polymerase sigma factor [Nitrolancea sp.]